jgi:hypothetical protein
MIDVLNIVLRHVRGSKWTSLFIKLCAPWNCWYCQWLVLLRGSVPSVRLSKVPLSTSERLQFHVTQHTHFVLQWWLHNRFLWKGRTYYVCSINKILINKNLTFFPQTFSVWEQIKKISFCTLFWTLYLSWSPQWLLFIIWYVDGLWAGMLLSKHGMPIVLYS